METQVLWSPEQGVCSQCGVEHIHVRRFTAQGSQTVFCAQCWGGFVDECNVQSGKWKKDVASSWNDDIALCLEYDGDHGAAQGTACWN